MKDVRAAGPAGGWGPQGRGERKMKDVRAAGPAGGWGPRLEAGP